MLAWLLVILYFVSGLGYLALRHFVWPHPERWLPQVEQRVSETIGRPISTGAVRTGFDGLRPSLEIDDLKIDEADGKPAFSARRVRAALSLRHLLAGQVRFAWLDIEAPVLRVERVAPTRLKLAGFVVDLDGTSGGQAGEGRLGWLLAQRRVVLRQAELDLVDHIAGRRVHLTQAALALGTVGRRHRVSLQLPMAPGLGRDFHAAIELWRPPFTGALDWRKWNGELYLGAARAELPALASLAAEVRRIADDLQGEGREVRSDTPAAAAPWLADLEAVRGVGAVRLWTRFDAGVPRDGVLKLAAVQAEVRLAGEPLPLADGRIELGLRRGLREEWLLRVRELVLRDEAGGQLAATDDPRNLLRFDPDGRLRSAGLSLQPLDAGRLLELARSLPLPERFSDPLAALRVAGSIDRLALDWELDASESRPRARYSVDARVDGLSAGYDGKPPPSGKPGIPSFDNLSGTITLSESGGRVTVGGRKAVLHFPGLFAEPSVPLDAVEGRASWFLRRDAADRFAQLEVDIESLRFASADAAGELSGRYTRRASGGLGAVDLSGRLSRADATRVARYLPLEVPAELRAWVARAVKAGRSDDARFVLRGELADFPYREPASGEFRVEAGLHEARLEYAPGWPAIERIAGRMVFDRASIDISVASGALWETALGATRARIDEYRNATLHVEGSSNGPARDLVRLVDESPFGARGRDFMRGLEVGGPASLQLKLEMPLRHLDDTRVAGTVRLAGNELSVDPSLPRFTQVAGRIAFDESSVALRELSGEFLGGPVRFDGEMSQAGRFVARASGQASAEGLRQLSENPLTQALDGAAAWRADLVVQAGAARLSIESDLVGLASRLPEPFNKRAQAAWPLRISATPAAAAATPGSASQRPARDLVQVSLRDDVQMAFERERDTQSQQMQVRRAAFSLGTEPLLPDSGFAVRLVAPSIDLDAWSAVLGGGLAGGAATVAPEQPGSAAGASLLPSQLSLVSERLRVAGKELNRVVVGATRSGGFWRANVHAREIDGFLSWRAALPGQPVGTLSARFSRLEIPRSRVDEVESLLDRAPSALPALDILAEQFVLNEHRLGHLSLKAVNTGGTAAPVWRLEQLRIENPAATLDANGSWQSLRGRRQRSTSLAFELTLRDAGQTLDTLGFQGTMRGGTGKLAGTVDWVGSPLSIDYPSLDGALVLAVDKGQFLRTEPGIAKLIGVLNLQSLRRRLSFDFRDIFAEGFAFDDIRGNASLAQGVARTDDFTMRGVSAEVRIRGQANLTAETQDLNVEVRPELNAGLASLAYAALANPAIGLGSFVAQLLLREPLQALFAWEYEVTGSWDDPQVKTKSRPAPPEMPPSGG